MQQIPKETADTLHGLAIQQIGHHLTIYTQLRVSGL